MHIRQIVNVLTVYQYSVLCEYLHVRHTFPFTDLIEDLLLIERDDSFTSRLSFKEETDLYSERIQGFVILNRRQVLKVSYNFIYRFSRIPTANKTR